MKCSKLYDKTVCQCSLSIYIGPTPASSGQSTTLSAPLCILVNIFMGRGRAGYRSESKYLAAFVEFGLAIGACHACATSVIIMTSGNLPETRLSFAFIFELVYERTFVGVLWTLKDTSDYDLGLHPLSSFSCNHHFDDPLGSTNLCLMHTGYSEFSIFLLHILVLDPWHISIGVPLPPYLQAMPLFTQQFYPFTQQGCILTGDGPVFGESRLSEGIPPK